MKHIYLPYIGLSSGLLPTALGGVSELTLLKYRQLDTTEGGIRLDANGRAQIMTTTIDHVEGPDNLKRGGTGIWHITDFDDLRMYTLTGPVTRSGDAITVTAPGSGDFADWTINGRPIHIPLTGVANVAGMVSVPANGIRGIPMTVSVTDYNTIIGPVTWTATRTSVTPPTVSSLPSIASSFTWTPMEDGQFTLKAAYTDGAANAEVVESISVGIIAPANQPGSITAVPSDLILGQSTTLTLSDADGIPASGVIWSDDATPAWTTSGGKSVQYTPTKAGIYKITAVYTDLKLHNETIVSDISIVVTKPANRAGTLLLTPASVAPGYVYNASVSDPDGTVTGPVEWTVDGVKKLGTLPTINIMAGAAGTYTVMASYTDAMGNAETPAATLVVKAANVVGKITLSAITAKTGGTIIGTLTDTNGIPNDVIWTSTSGDPVTGTSKDGTMTAVTIGTFKLEARYTDLAGNIETVSSPSYTVSAADIPGYIELSAVQTTVNTNVTATIRDANGAPTSGVAWAVNGIANVTSTSAVLNWKPQAEGDYVISATYTDKNNYSSTITADTITVGAIPNATGTVTLTPASPITVGTTVTAQLNDADAITISTIVWKVNGTQIATGTKTATYKAPSDGVYSITASYKQTNGLSDTATADLVVDLAANTAGVIDVTPTSTPTSGQSVTFKLTDAELVKAGTVKWTINGITNISSVSDTLIYKIPKVGTFDVVATYTQGNGVANQTASANVSSVAMPNEPGIISISPTTTPLVNDIVTFSVSDPEIVKTGTVRWSVNGALVSTADTYSYTCIQAGTFPVSVTYSQMDGVINQTAPVVQMTVGAMINLPGTISINPSTTPLQNDSVTFSVSDPETVKPGTVRWYVNGSLVSSLDTYTYKCTQLGTFPVTVTYAQMNGVTNQSAPAVQLTVGAMVNLPGTISISPTTTPMYNDSVTFSVYDPEVVKPGTVRWSVNGSLVSSLDTYTYKCSQIGTFPVSVTYTQMDGVVNQSAPVVQLSVSAAPNGTGRVVLPKSSILLNESIVVSVTDPELVTAGTVKWTVNGIANSSSTSDTLTYSTGTAGSYVFGATYTQGDGLTNQVATTAQLSVSKAANIAGTMTMSTTSLTVGGTVTAEVLDTDGRAAGGYKWSYVPTSGAAGVLLSTGPTCSWTPTVAGSYHLVAEYIDLKGNSETVAGAQFMVAAAFVNTPGVVYATVNGIRVTSVAWGDTVKINISDPDTVSTANSITYQTIIGGVTTTVTGGTFTAPSTVTSMQIKALYTDGAAKYETPSATLTVTAVSDTLGIITVPTSVDSGGSFEAILTDDDVVTGTVAWTFTNGATTTSTTQTATVVCPVTVSGTTVTITAKYKDKWNRASTAISSPITITPAIDTAGIINVDRVAKPGAILNMALVDPDVPTGAVRWIVDNGATISGTTQNVTLTCPQNTLKSFKMGSLVDTASSVLGSSWTVPAGVTSIKVEIAGGDGAKGGVDTGTGSSGMKGGVVTATIAVTPGQVISSVLGKAGTAGILTNVSTVKGGAGGAGRITGGTGGGTGSAAYSGTGGGGGGSSAIMIGGTVMVEAAGGAGGGGKGGSYTALSEPRTYAAYLASPIHIASGLDGESRLTTASGGGGGGGGGGNTSGWGGALISGNAMGYGGVSGKSYADTSASVMAINDVPGLTIAPVDGYIRISYIAAVDLNIVASYNDALGRASTATATVSISESAVLTLGNIVNAGALALPTTWTVPIGVSEVKIELSGGVGGNGGSYINTRGKGIYGDRITATVPVRPGDVLTTTLGIGGLSPRNTVFDTGKPYGPAGGIGYHAGGKGGNAGASGSAGIGGAGGGSTGILLNGVLLFEAAGGAGGGGSDTNSAGGTGRSYADYLAKPTTFSTTIDGKNTSGDGAGGGGGGGGYSPGFGGYCTGGNSGARAGCTGTSYTDTVRSTAIVTHSTVINPTGYTTAEINIKTVDGYVILTYSKV